VRAKATERKPRLKARERNHKPGREPKREKDTYLNTRSQRVKERAQAPVVNGKRMKSHISIDYHPFIRQGIPNLVLFNVYCILACHVLLSVLFNGYTSLADFSMTCSMADMVHDLSLSYPTCSTLGWVAAHT